MAAIASAFAGAFVGGFAAGLTGNTALSLTLLLPTTLGAAHLAGRWIARRDSAPSQVELKLGCLLYVVGSALLGIGSRHSAGLIGFVVSFGIVWVLHRAASAPYERTARTTQTAG